MRQSIILLVFLTIIGIIYILYFSNNNNNNNSPPVKNCSLTIKSTNCQNGTYSSVVTVVNTAINTDCVYKNTKLKNVTGYRTELNYTCSVDCVVGKTYNYGSCDGSKRIKTRIGDIPPLKGGIKCPPVQEIESCRHCILGTSYSPYTICDGTSRSRVRTGDISPLNGGNDCPTTSEVQTCNHCTISNWSSWSLCNSSCGTNGTKTKNKIVTMTATNGGTCSVDNVTGKVVESQTVSCNRFTCDVLTYTNTNTTTVTIPEGVKKLNITLIGGGGGGGHPSLSNMPNELGPAYGGGAGSVYKNTINVVDGVSTYKITVGRGGGPKTNGGNTVFEYNGVNYNANGGIAGQYGEGVIGIQLIGNVYYVIPKKGVDLGNCPFGTSSWCKAADVGITVSGGLAGTQNTEAGNGGFPGAGGGGASGNYTGINPVNFKTPGSGGNGVAYVSYTS
jgi:hypothetical protein